MQLTRLNFVAARTSTRGWRMAVLCLGVIALAISGANCFSQYEANAALNEKLQKTRPRAAPKPAISAARQRELQEQVKTVKAAVHQLNVPIFELIKALQPPKDIRVVLLGLDIDSSKGASEGAASNSTGLLKVTAEAKTPQEMTTYVAFLSDQSLFQSVYLVKHELYSSSPEKPYRFLLEAQWQK